MFHALRQCYIPARAKNALLGQRWRLISSPSTANIISPWKPRTDPSGMEPEFKSLVRKFDHVEERGLRIRIMNCASFPGAMGIRKANKPPPSSVTDLYLDKIGFSEILSFDPIVHPEISDAACSFLGKLSIVAMNNLQNTDIFRETLFIKNMAVDLMRAVNYDDGRELTMSPSILRLAVGNEEFAAEVDKTVRKGNDIVCVVNENKHITDLKDKNNDIQLAACMIAAYQENAEPANETYPERMMGIKIRGDDINFYSMRMTTTYRNSLFGGLPKEDIEIFKYPGKKGLRITVPKDRKQILDHLWSMRCYAAGLKKSIGTTKKRY